MNDLKAAIGTLQASIGLSQKFKASKPAIIPMETAKTALAALIRGNSDQDELSAYRATGLTPEAVQEMVSFPYTADDEEETEMMANQCVVCGHEMPEGDHVCGYCRRRHEC